jgi:Zn finger protein HypA/HybF involved in hydrogenase expression
MRKYNKANGAVICEACFNTITKEDEQMFCPYCYKNNSVNAAILKGIADLEQIRIGCE